MCPQTSGYTVPDTGPRRSAHLQQRRKVVRQAGGTIVVPARVQSDARLQRAQADLALQVRGRGAARGGVAARGRALRTI